MSEEKEASAIEELNPQKGKTKSGKKLKIYGIVMTVVAAVLLAAVLVLFFKGGFDEKLLVKLGIKERESSDEVSKTISGWTNTLDKLDISVDVVFFGDSITQNSDFTQYFSDISIVNLGRNGDLITGMAERVDQIVAVNPQKVFVLGGVNELRDNNIQVCFEEYTAMLDDISTKLPETDVYVQSILPIDMGWQDGVGEHDETIREFNELLKSAAAERGMTYVDIYTLYEKDGEINEEYAIDGLHLKEEAYQLWADAIKEYVYEGLNMEYTSEEVGSAAVNNKIHEDAANQLVVGNIVKAAKYEEKLEEKYDAAVVAWDDTLEDLNLNVDVAFYGDSITRANDFQRFFEEKNVINLGLGGNTILGMIDRVEMLSSVNPKKVFVMCGVNALRDNNINLCEAQYGELLDAIQAEVPNAQIYVESILPVVKWMQEWLPCSAATTEDFNARIKALAEERGMTYIDLYSLYVKDGEMNGDYSEDGVHPKYDGGYDIWMDAIRPYVYD